MSKKKTPQPEKVYIEYMPLSGLALAPRNPKQHEVEEIKASFRRFGFVQVPSINETTGRLCAGHGRREALVEMKEAGEPAPARIQVRDGEWYVPVLRGVAFTTDEEAEAYLLADNRLSDIGGYDDAELARVLADLKKTTEGLQGTGYTEDDLQALLAFGTGGGGENGAGAPGELPDVPGYEAPPQQPRLIIICKTKEEVERLQVRLGLEPGGNKVTYLFENITWEADGVR
jgi:hypothetical protein